MPRSGDVVSVLTKDDPKFPTKEVGEIIERQGQIVQGEGLYEAERSIETEVEKLTLEYRKRTPEEMWDRLAKAMASVESASADQRAMGVQVRAPYWMIGS